MLTDSLAVADSDFIPIICGPTASGKTPVAFELAESIALEIISADSRQVIRHLDIGTAKPTEEERQKVTFHLVDIVEPGERYTAFRFIEDANFAIRQIRRRGRLPVVVGGTGLYLRALTEGVVQVDGEGMGIRRELERQMESLGPKVMHEKLTAVDPAQAALIHPNNRTRVIRALEMYQITGRPKSELVIDGTYRKSNYRFRQYCLMPDRRHLYETINKRVDFMVEQGLVLEIKSLIDRGLGSAVRAAGVIGYAELLDYTDGLLTRDEAIRLIKQNTRRYAKRQITWLRKNHRGNSYTDRSALLEALKRDLVAAGKITRRQPGI